MIKFLEAMKKVSIFWIKIVIIFCALYIFGISWIPVYNDGEMSSIMFEALRLNFSNVGAIGFTFIFLGFIGSLFYKMLHKKLNISQNIPSMLFTLIAVGDLLAFFELMSGQ